MLSRLVIAFLPRSKRLLISWLQSPSAVILEPRKIKFLTVSIVSPSICYEVIGLDAMILAFWILNFKPTFSLSSFTFIKRLFSSSLPAIRVVSSAYLRLLIFLLASWFQLVLHPAWHFTWCTSVYKLNKQGDNTALMYSFPNLEPVRCSVSSSNCCFLTSIQISQEVSQILLFLSLELSVWHFFCNFSQSIALICHTIKVSGRLGDTKSYIFWFYFICRWHHPYGRKWRRTKEPLDESEKGEEKSWLKTQHSEN